MKASKPRGPGLLTREERYLLRLDYRDLQARLERARTSEQRDALERALDSVRREQQADRASRPRQKKERARS